jgi:excisionase family DNA binding protein
MSEETSRFDRERRWMDLKALTRYVSISERTLREWIHRAVDPLPAVRVDTKILVDRDLFDRWLESHPLCPAGSLDLSHAADEMLAGLT